MKLSELQIGQRATVMGFQKDDLAIKLMEMGLIPGEKIYIEKFAPLGDPISVFVAGYRLSLRLDEAERVDVDIIK